MRHFMVMRCRFYLKPIIQLISARSFWCLLASFNWPLTDWKSRPVSGNQSNQLNQQYCQRRCTYIPRNCPLKRLRSYVWMMCFTQENRRKKLYKNNKKVRVLQYRNCTRVLGRPSEYSSTRVLVAIPNWKVSNIFPISISNKFKCIFYF